MKLYIYAESDELEKIRPTLHEAINQWLNDESTKVEATAINDDNGETPGPVGIHLQVKKPVHLKEPLNFLQRQAKSLKCDFVLGCWSDDDQDREDICFFGHEEGKPDMFEIACYIGLE